MEVHTKSLLVLYCYHQVCSSSRPYFLHSEGHTHNAQRS